MLHRFVFYPATGLAMMLSSVADAQMRPATSGALSFEEPELRKHGEGFFRPGEPGQKLRRNRPKRLFRSR